MVIYDDLPEERYHFPKTYLRPVEAAVGDFIIYYEPGRVGVGDAVRIGRQSYTATAKVIDLQSDPRHTDHYYASIDPETYIEFDTAVPFRTGEHFLGTSPPA